MPQAQGRVYMQGTCLARPTSLAHLNTSLPLVLVPRKLAHTFLPKKLAGNLNASSSFSCPWSGKTAILPLSFHLLIIANSQ